MFFTREKILVVFNSRDVPEITDIKEVIAQDVKALTLSTNRSSLGHTMVIDAAIELAFSLLHLEVQKHSPTID